MHLAIPVFLLLSAVSAGGVDQGTTPPLQNGTTTRPFTAEELDRFAADYRQRAEESRRQAADLRRSEAREIGQTPLLSKAPYHPWLRRIRDRYAALIAESERQASEAGASATYFANRALERRLEAQRP